MSELTVDSTIQSWPDFAGVDVVRFAVGDYRHLPSLNLTTKWQTLIGEGDFSDPLNRVYLPQVRFRESHVKLSNVWFENVSIIDIQNVNNITIERFGIKDWTGQSPIRTYGHSHSNTFQDGFIGRFQAPWSSGDSLPVISGNWKVDPVTGEYSSTGQWQPMDSYHNTVRRMTILNCTDAFQPANVQRFTSYRGRARGTLFEDCIMGFTEESRGPLHWPGIEGIPDEEQNGEQAGLDCKSGGTELEPLIIRNCIVFGSRPAWNKPAINQAFVFHLGCTHVRMENVIISDCDAGISLSPLTQAENGEGNPQPLSWENPNWHFDNLLFTDINPKSPRTGHDGYDANKGRAFVSANTMKLTNSTFLNVHQFANEHGRKIPFTLSGNSWHGPTNWGGTYTDAAWLSNGNELCQGAATENIKANLLYCDKQINIEIPSGYKHKLIL